jgi:hypothetical protein
MLPMFSRAPKRLQARLELGAWGTCPSGSLFFRAAEVTVVPVVTAPGSPGFLWPHRSRLEIWHWPQLSPGSWDSGRGGGWGGVACPCHLALVSVPVPTLGHVQLGDELTSRLSLQS